jgi:hypothetical protein
MYDEVFGILGFYAAECIVNLVDDYLLDDFLSFLGY